MHAMNRALAAIYVVVGVAAIHAPAAYGQGAVPAGDEIQVNAYATGAQVRPAVAPLADGGFVTSWLSQGSSGSDASGTSIQARRHAADGSPLGGEFQVNAYTTGDQRDPAVATLTDGGFVVVWHEDRAVRGQVFEIDGSPRAGEFVVAASHPDAFFQYGDASVAALAGGGFVVVWGGDAFPEIAVRGRRYAADGTPLGSRFTADFDVVELAVTGLADGDFVVAWNQGFIGYHAIYSQRYSGDSAAGARNLISSSATSTWRGSVALAADPGGGFVATWESGKSATSVPPADIDIKARRFTTMEIEPIFRVNTHTAGRQRLPAVTTGDDGGFVIAWQSEGSIGSDSAGTSVQGQRYAPDGQPLGGEFQLNALTAGDQHQPAVAALDGGGLAAAWDSEASNGPDASGASVQARRFDPPRYALVGLAGKCLDVEDADTADGTPANLFTCHGGDNQSWRLELTELPQRVVGIAGKCLVPGPVLSSGSVRLVIGECGGPGDLWRLAAPGHAAPSTLVHDDTGLCLDVRGESTADGAATILFPCHGDANQQWRPAAEVCTRDALGLCLNGSRFRVDVDWRDPVGNTGSSRAVPVASDDSGLLWFFSADNWEMLIKVLDGCAINDRLWVFAAATTDVEYTLRVTDTVAGGIREYTNPLGTASPAITDTAAFATCPAGSAVEQPILGTVPASSISGVVKSSVDIDAKGLCIPSDVDLCLNDDRFLVEVEWRDPAGNRGSGRVVPVDSRDSGLLWFFSENNWEMLVKVLDGCRVNDRYWVFAAATTDVEYTLRVTDLDSGEVQEYVNPLGTASPAITDTSAFATCP